MSRRFFFSLIAFFLPLVAHADIGLLPISAKFIVSLISDDDGGLWIGSEDDGIFRYTNSGDVKHYTVTDGLGDNNGYALALDQQNRLWVGHLNTGVSVFNGNDWQNYDVLDALIGERVFAIQVCPVDGDVWIATSAGITRYKNKTDDWEDFTRADGLPEDQCSSLAFQKDGTLIVGTQCYGICIFTRDASGNYCYDKTIDAPDRFGADGISPVPFVPAGKILPTNLINDVIADVEDTVWIATSAGLVQADKTLKKFQYTRGKDYADKVRGLYGGAPKDWKECPPEVMQQLLPEDYVTTLALAGDGKLWLGFRQHGLILFDPKTKERTLFGKNEKLPDNFVTTILSDAFGNIFAGTYGGGVAVIERGTAKVNVTKKKDPAPLPSKRKALTLEQLKTLEKKLDPLDKILPNVYAGYLGEDWKTQGDWVGRYGRKESCMCAAAAPFDHFVQSSPLIDLWACIGPNCKNDDEMRRWVHWLKTDNPKTMYSPYDGYRRQAEWDDHGEAYSMKQDGPNMWIYLDIGEEEEATLSNLQPLDEWVQYLVTQKLPYPGYHRKGLYRVSMYFFNKDGHERHNRFRDYLLEVYPCPIPKNFNDELKFAKSIERITRKQHPLVKTRVSDFWGGVHKSFLLMGPGRYVIKINRNYSFNTIISSVCTDHFGKWQDEVANPEFPLQLMYEVRVEPPPIPVTNPSALSRSAVSLWETNEEKTGRAGFLENYRVNRIAAYRSAMTAAEGAKKDSVQQVVVKSFAWQLYQWDTEMRKEFAVLMQKAWKRLGEVNPNYRKQQEELMRQREEGTWKPPFGDLE